MIVFGGLAAFVLGKRRKARPVNDFAVDPHDPVQSIGIEDAQLVDFDVDAEVARDLDGLDPLPALPREELYGLQPVIDAELVDDDQAARGENWVEALETEAIENDPRPGRDLVIDEGDDMQTSPRIDLRDIPVADRGSAGPRGL
ncbi:MAG: hypothetical protein ABI867_37640 [Kofleriaceae bacterium]